MGKEVVGVVFDGFLRATKRLVQVAQFLMAMRHRLVHIGEFRVDVERLREVVEGAGEILLGEFDHTALIQRDFVLCCHGLLLRLAGITA